MRNSILFFAGLLLVMACAKTKSVVVKTRELKQIENIQLYDSVIDNYGSYSTFSSKFTAEVTNPKPVQIKGNLKIKKDSVIWVSITPALNIEAFRCVFTQDSVMFLNRIDKVYYQGGYDFISKMAGVTMNFKTIQSVLLNELLFYPFESGFDTIQEVKKYKINKRPRDLVMQNYSYKERRALSGRKVDSLLIIQSINIAIDNFRVSEFQIADESKNLKVETKYSMYNYIDSITFPQMLTFEVKNNKKKMHLMINYDKVEFNIDQSYPFNINSKYKLFQN